ncbi:hypothetical protein TRFO_20768 [Tritrichomonas foetus]|uniref:Uncharacterized protein n=1 Tax=Tritrichomonas foetus TaxID=1144522 RepID=A0A1J4KGE2_9EUKA|nr:hypothetical protein TRFO_20768 [Tritrichomonas foetus]|eukprot:OHT10114.1 hypothetical protein TRFO_20768 [Tritrichomonas foetus]
MELVMMCALTVKQKIQKLHQLHARWCKKDARPDPKVNKIAIPENVGEQKGGAFGGGKRSGGKSDDDDRLHFYDGSSTDEEVREVVNGINYITSANELVEIVNISSEDEDSVPSNDPYGSEASDPSGSQFLDPSGSPLICQITGNTFEEDAKHIEDVGRL